MARCSRGRETTRWSDRTHSSVVFSLARRNRSRPATSGCAMSNRLIAPVAFLAAASATLAFTTEPPREIFVRSARLENPRHSDAARSASGLRYAENAASQSPGDGEITEADVPPFVTSTVLEQVYPALIAHKKAYGNPNIPLGSVDGKRCKTLRRMHYQNKLSEEEANHLAELGFRFHSFEDVYYECDFDEMLTKLTEYRDATGTYQIPKKYDPDPELGAWVTMLRRLNRTGDLPQLQIDKLDAVGFEWISSRKCGSSFMSRYREVFSYLAKVTEAGGDVRELLHEDNGVIRWIEAQRLAHEKGNLSDARVKYMDELPGIDWKNPSSWA